MSCTKDNLGKPGTPEQKRAWRAQMKILWIVHNRTKTCTLSVSGAVSKSFGDGSAKFLIVLLTADSLQQVWSLFQRPDSGNHKILNLGCKWTHAMKCLPKSYFTTKVGFIIYTGTSQAKVWERNIGIRTCAMRNNVCFQRYLVCRYHIALPPILTCLCERNINSLQWVLGRHVIPDHPRKGQLAIPASVMHGEDNDHDVSTTPTLLICFQDSMGWVPFILCCTCSPNWQRTYSNICAGHLLMCKRPPILEEPGSPGGPWRPRHYKQGTENSKAVTEPRWLAKAVTWWWLIEKIQYDMAEQPQGNQQTHYPQWCDEGTQASSCLVSTEPAAFKEVHQRSQSKEYSWAGRSGALETW